MECVDSMRAMRDILPKFCRDDWDNICDSIEAEGQRIADAVRSESADMRDFCERVEEAAKKHEDVTLFGVDYVALPLDFDGKPIHIGDKVRFVPSGVPFEVKEIRYIVGYETEVGDGEQYGTLVAASCAHCDGRTVPDILREFALACEEAGNAGPEVERIAAEYAEKLQIKGE